MKDVKLWKFIVERLHKNQPVIFLCVLESSGSSPGRQGFKMAVANDDMCGSIGGGIMEHKFVEVARGLLSQHKDEAFVKKQIHSKSAPANQSGMICSGEQTLAVYAVKKQDIAAIEMIINAMENDTSLIFGFSNSGFEIPENATQSDAFVFEKKSETGFHYTEKLGFMERVHIIGGGHCSLAFSKLMKELNFFVSVYDDREELFTMQQNIFAHTKATCNYEKIADEIQEGENEYVVIMTFGYRSDGVVLRQLLDKKFRYLGLLGSKAKIEKMFSELRSEGIDDLVLKSIHAPVGLPIKSRTPEEIAISIAAEIIKVKNVNMK